MQIADKTLHKIVVVGLGATLPGIAFAQIVSPIQSENIPELIQYILDQAFPIVLGVAVIFIMYGGFTIAKAGGNESEYKKGKDAVIYAVVGLLIVAAAQAIVNGFLNSTGLQ